MINDMKWVKLELENLKNEITKMKRYGDSDGEKYPYKDLLLLLVLSHYENGNGKNVFYYSDLEDDLTRLMKEYSGREFDSAERPDRPFFHLNTSYFWRMYPEKYNKSEMSKSLSGKKLREDNVYGYFLPHIHNLLTFYPLFRKEILLHTFEKGGWGLKAKNELVIKLNIQLDIEGK